MNSTRRYPRTLCEAFGPYASGPVLPIPEPEPLGHKVAKWLSAVVGVVLVGLIAMGVV